MRINRLNIGDHLVEYQLKLAGKTMADALKDTMWFFNWTITEEQYKQYKGYAIPLIKKIFKCNKARAEETFGWFNLNFGLRIKD